MNELLTLILYAVFVALAYGLVGYISAALKNNEPLDPKRIAATIVYSIFVGIVGVYTGVLTYGSINFTIFDPLFAQYLTVLYVVNKTVDAVWDWYKQKTGQSATAVPNDFSILPKESEVGIPVTFTDVTDEKLIRLWDFGDGTFSNDVPVATHTYKKAGTFIVWATAYQGNYHSLLKKTIVITGITPPEPVIGYWEKLIRAIRDFINALFGK